VEEVDVEEDDNQSLDESVSNNPRERALLAEAEKEQALKARKTRSSAIFAM